MGFWDFLTGTKRPPSGTPTLSKQEVLGKLINLNRPTAPYQLINGQAQNVDLIAEWKIVEAQWYEIFAKAGLTKVFKIYLKLDDHAHQVRAMDREYTVAWSAGIPKLSIAASTFKGQTTAVEFGKAYAFTETLIPGQVYNYNPSCYLSW